MLSTRLAWIGVLALHAVWLFLIPTTSGKALAIVGAALAALLAWRRPEPHRQVAPATLLPFLLPALAFIRVPTIAFWRIDGRVWLILAWVAYAIVLECASSASRSTARDAGPAVPTPIGLFVAWSSALWLTVVFDLGIGRLIGSLDRAVTGPCRVDWLSTMIAIWDRVPASEHLFLAWRSESAFASRMVYENHVHPYLFLMYGWIAAVRAATHVPLFVASNSTALLAMLVVIAAFVVLLARTGILRSCSGAAGWLSVFVAVGLVITTARFWGDLFRFNTDNPYPILGALLVVIYALLVEPAAARWAVAAAVTFVALSPIHLPMLVLAVACLFGRPGHNLRDVVARNRLVIRVCVWSTVAAIVVMAAPWTLVALKGYHGQASTFLYRSGLDGDTTYLKNALQAVWSGCPGNCCGTPRPIAQLLFPAFLPLLVYAWPVVRSGESARFGGLGRAALFLATPYLVSLIFFPQSVAVHPYLYDHLLIVPAVMLGAAAMTVPAIQRRLNGTSLLAFLLFAAALIMSNLISIAQSIRVP